MATAFLTNLNGEIQLALLIGDKLVPIIVGAVKDIKSFLNETQEIEYTVVITTGQQNNQSTIDSATTALNEINAERTKAGLPPLPIPGQ